MIGSFVVYTGVVLAAAGALLALKPVARLGVPTRGRAVTVAATGVAFAIVGLALPATEARADSRRTALDQFVPVWQFREYHAIEVDAPPLRVFDAIKRVRADEILLFRTLTWIRRGGRPLPPGILNAGERAPLLDIATRGGFVRLADDAPREIVVGTVIMAPAGTRGTLTPAVFQKQLPPGFVLAAMNFLVSENGPRGSLVSTETRVYANSPSARRRFAAYWRIIYPGSALIRRMWLRAIAIRANVPR